MWKYTPKVMDHFLNPRNVGEMENPDATAEVGNVSCGDALRIFLKVNKETGVIEDVKFKTFGCASAIASSSAMTEIVKGKTLEEAAAITNSDIVEVLGELPEEKMHCSVMGMEALHAAILNYKKNGGNVPDGILQEEGDDDHEGRIVCKCFGVTDTKIRRVVLENNLETLEQVTSYTKAGGACSLCLDQIQEILDGILRERKGGVKTAPEAVEKELTPEEKFAALSPVKRVLLVQETIERDIRPALVKDGGDIELIDMDGDIVKVSLRGRCASCPNAKLTLKKLVQSKLNEFVSSSLIVEEAK